MADLHDTRVTVETVRTLLSSSIDSSSHVCTQGILPEIIAGLKEVLLRVENGEELGKIASSLEECEDASSCALSLFAVQNQSRALQVLVLA